MSWPHLKLDDLWVLLPSAAGMMLVIFSEALGAGQTFADKHGYRLESSRPQITLLGADPVVPGAFADISRHDGIAPVPGVLIVRPDAPASGRPAGPG